ncbi:MAG: polysaccharide deacetylase family protein [Treponema sp.]|nr:polysaccharide deacetylase family protein [Treponema sp.]
MDKTFLLAVILTAFIIGAGGCNNDDKDEGDGYNEDIIKYPYTVESIEKEINDNWELLGYTEKPTKYIALTFDDGPAAETQDLLDILAAKQVKATFFLIGQNIRSNKAATKAIFDAGHELANHSDGYDGLGGATESEKIEISLVKASAEIKAITGKDPAFFRAPNVAYGNNLTNVCKIMGMPLIGVSVWSNDWQSSITAEQCKSNVLNAAKDGGIINCHEANTSKDRTLPILGDMIDGLRAKGYWITTVSKLAVVKGKTLQPGERYDSIN